MDWELVRNFFIAMLAITNPLTKIPLWVEGSADEDEHVRWRLAALLTATALAILLLFLIGGRHFLDLFGIDLASFRVGGGVVILLVALDMLRGKAVQVERESGGRDAPTKLAAARSRFEQVVVPLAVPIMAGPGSITTVVVYSARADGLHEYLALAGTLALVIAIMFAVLLGGSTLERLVGRTVLDLQTRLFGLILAGIAAQLVVEGLGAVFPAWVTTESAILDELRDGP